VLDRAGVITYASRSWQEFAGQNDGRQERIGVGVNYLSVCRAAQTDDPTVREVFEGIKAVMAGERSTFSIEYPCHSPAQQRWFLMQVDPMPPEQGGVVISHVNITERRQAEASVRESEKRFRVTFEQAAVGVAHSSPDGRLLLMNQKLCDILGYTPEEILTKTYQEVTHPEDVEMELAYARSLLAGEIQACSFEKRYVRKDGSAVWVNLTASLVRDEQTGEPSYFVAIIEDIGARKAAEQSLKSALEEVRLLKDRLQEENVYLREEAKLERHFGEIVGRSDAISFVLRKVERVAPTDATVLITGETGTGKELVARAIHGESARCDRPLINVNCAALSPSLIESELFGHEKGAFTGAAGRKIGRFELADKGTIFLDEIGEIPLELQPKLLRVLQEGEFERLGSAHTVRADVRVIAATNRDLWQDVQAGRFRSDLFYRLNVYPIIVPPLRERREDIALLVQHFVEVFSKKMGKEITSVAPATLEVLSNYLWPGNVRELANVIERAVITTSGTVLQISNITETLPARAPQKLSKTMEEVEREHITAVLEASGWKIEGPEGAAKTLGLNPSTLRARMKKLKIQNRKSWPPPR
jgi:PAS domain S-box-containing protein